MIEKIQQEMHLSRIVFGVWYMVILKFNTSFIKDVAKQVLICCTAKDDNVYWTTK